MFQICNWFANWRRKLKNSGKNVRKFTWSTLIKSYNNHALGNVEHLSISSDDSIWEESEPVQFNQCNEVKPPKHEQPVDHCYSSVQSIIKKPLDPRKHSISSQTTTDHTNKSDCLPQCFQISSTTDFVTEFPKAVKIRKKMNFSKKPHTTNDKIFNKHLGNKRKKPPRDKNWNYRKMMEEFRATSNHFISSKECQIEGDPFLLSKWRKSVALFQPSCKMYTSSGGVQKKGKSLFKNYENLHGKEELDAAEALTFLSRASSNK